MKRIIKADMFIIPNGKRVVKDIFNYKNRISEFNDATGMRIRENDLVVEVWITSDHDLGENWQCHTGWKEICQLEETAQPRLFPSYFPVNVLEAFEEGDVLRVSPIGTDVIIELTLNQLGYRYKNWGRFEECLQKLS